MGRKLKNLFHLLLAILANVFFGFPSRKLTVVGVTGTDGKTTTATLIWHILRTAGQPVGLISSVAAYIDDEEIDTGFHVTTPDPWALQKFLRLMVDKGLRYAVIEVTSHGLDQHRLFGVDFQIGVVTNVTHEHLDYHRTYENYLAAKAKLFRSVKIAVLNCDDRSFDLLKLATRNAPACLPGGRHGRTGRQLITYAIKNKADFTPENFKFKTSLPGEYNQYNCLAAIAAVSSLKISQEKIRKAVASFKEVEGRMEEIDEGQDFKVIIDFAHTPNALENALKTLKKLPHRKLIAVFGCAGLRDFQKRPAMGEIAGRLADMAVLTAEDPRTEDVNIIIDQIVEGCKKARGQEGKSFFRVPDRAEAVRFAIQKLAKKGDIIVFCGKGHEKSMCYGTIEQPWSDHEEARKALKNLK